MKTFKTRDMNQVTVAAMWSTLCSLDVALNLKNIGFANLDIVCSELVKFLLVNSGYQFIAKLEKKVKNLEKAKTDLQKSVKGVSSSAATATNKTDEMKKRINLFEKPLEEGGG